MTTSKQGFGTMKDMWHLVKKWYVLNRLLKELAYHSKLEPSERLLAGSEVVVTQRLFVEKLAHRSVKRWPWIFLWKLLKREKLFKAKVYEYNKIIQSLTHGLPKNVPYIARTRIDNGTLVPDEHGNFLITLPNVDDVRGWFGLAQWVLTKYKVAWAALIAPLLAGIISSPYIYRILSYLLGLIEPNG